MQPNELNVVIAQLNLTVGDIQGNKEKILLAIEKASHELKGDIIVFPELAITGYPPEDLLLRHDFHQQVAHALEKIAPASQSIDVVVGHPHLTDKKVYNAASVFQKGKLVLRYYKQFRPNYSVFDEKRYFQAGDTAGIFEKNGTKIGVVICEDLWRDPPAQQAKQAGAQLLLSLNASPFHVNKPKEREELMCKRAKEHHLPIIYVHCVGGQDLLIFDGGSMAINAKGEVCQRLSFFEERISTVECTFKHNIPDEFRVLARRGDGEQARCTESTLSLRDEPQQRQNEKGEGYIIEITPTPLIDLPGEEASVYSALRLGVRDYVRKNGFQKVYVGTSGGIDSALTLTLAADALGSENVTAVMMPSRYTSDISLRDAKALAQSLGVRYQEISIEPAFEAFLQSLHNDFQHLSASTTEENIQARCRAIILMALANKHHALVLTASNKSEVAVGYTTLYGDMAGAFGVLSDVYKTWVYRLAEYRNQITPVIPKPILTRAPTAELRPNQCDQDNLPPYKILDEILYHYVEEDKGIAEIVRLGFEKELVKKIIHLVDINEHKRRQAPPCIRISKRAFGRERRYPITSGFQPAAEI